MPARGSGRIVGILGLDLTEWQKGLRAAERALKTAAARIGDVGRSLSVAFTAPLAAAGGAAVKFAGDFDRAMARSTAVMGNLDEAMRRTLRDTALETSKTSVFAAEQIAESYFFLASAGLDAQQSLAALPQVIQFATAGAFDLARATDLITDAQSALGLSVKDATANLENMRRVSDVLIKANTLANATAEQFSESLTTKAGPAFRAVGKDVEEAVAVLAAFADQGIKGAEAGTQASIVLRDLSTKARENSEAFERFGVRVFDATGEMRNLGAIVEDLERSLAGASDETRGATLALLGFSDKSIAALQALIGVSAKIKDYEAALRQAGGTTADVAEKQTANFSDRMTMLGNSLRVAAIRLGDALIPSLERLGALLSRGIGFLELAARGLGALDEGGRKWALTIGLLAAGIGPLLLAVAALSKALAGLAAAVQFLSAHPLVALLSVLGAAVAAVGAYSAASYIAADSQERLARAAETAGEAVGVASDKLRQFAERSRELARLRAELAALERELDIRRRQRDPAQDITAEPGPGTAFLRKRAEELQAAIARLEETTNSATRATLELELAEAKAADSVGRLNERINVANGVHAATGDELRRVAEVLAAYETHLRELIEAGIDPADERIRSATISVRYFREEYERLQAIGESGPSAFEKVGAAIAAFASDLDARSAGTIERLGAIWNGIKETITDVGRSLTGEGQAAVSAWQTWIIGLGEQLQTFGEFVYDVFDGITTAIGQTVALAITDTANFHDAVTALWKSLVANIVANLVKLLAQYVIYSLAKRALDKKDATTTVFTAAGETFAVVFRDVRKYFGPILGDVLAPILAAAAAAAVLAGGLAFFAEGGLVTGPTLGVVGEAGPELIVPLDRVADVIGRTGPTIILEVDRRTIGRLAMDGALSEARVRLGQGLF